MQVFISLRSGRPCYLRAKEWLHPTCMRVQSPSVVILIPLISWPFVQDQLSRMAHGLSGKIAISNSPREPNERLLTASSSELSAGFCEFGEGVFLRRLRELQFCHPPAPRGRNSRRRMRSGLPLLVAGIRATLSWTTPNVSPRTRTKCGLDSCAALRPFRVKPI